MAKAFKSYQRRRHNIVLQHSVLQQKGTHSTYEVESHTIYIPSKILSQPNFLCAVTKQGFFLGVLAKTQFVQNAKTQFENTKTQFENAKTQFEN